ncbi:hypothetical protein [Cobetia sp. L2A1]|uniref:hypothetical protein n=1 Tax=Cobetia sp. L2A1 TaxID=2686360 RepID=UPI00131B1545|nr:hypothetical protein [Cobetia sp. L2A1]
MKKDTLYLHVGWSKTGTSAVQSQIQAQYADFLDKGILYPQSLQWPDHSHHPFALSFQGSGAYQSDMSPADALEKLRIEMEESPAPSVLLSSELSPMYFNNPRFRIFVAEHFETVKVLFTVRPQSELLLSLYNQLVKDPNIRYDASLFTLALRNIGWLNYLNHIRQWEKHVGEENLSVLPYSRRVVQDFLQAFDIEYRQDARQLSETAIINPSLPTRCLLLVQKFGRGASGNGEFAQRRDKIIALSKAIDHEHDQKILFSVAEQQAFDANFKQGNEKLIELFELPSAGLIKTDYSPINVLPEDSLSLDDLA